MTSKFGDAGEGEQRGKRIPLAASVTAVRDSGKLVSESLKAEGKRKIPGKR